MEAINFTAKTKTLELNQVPIPKISNPDEVLIKVAYAGVCGTDLHIIHGNFACNQTKTFTMGHEFSGTVVDVNSDVTILKNGDKVVVDPHDSCRCCDFCHSGNPHNCPMGGINNSIGIHRNGGWAHYVVAPLSQVHKVPDSVTLQEAVLTEPLSCLTHGWDLANPVTVGMKILIMGAGIIGNLWVCAFHLQGHRNVTVSEPNTTRLNTLKNLDTGYTLITPDQLTKSQQADPEYLFDLIIDCSGYPPAVEQAVALLQRGGKLCCFGLGSPNAEIKIRHADILIKELKIFGVNINPFSFPKALGLLEAMGKRYLNYESLGIKTFALGEYKDALDALKRGTISKAVFKI